MFKTWCITDMLYKDALESIIEFIEECITSILNGFYY